MVEGRRRVGNGIVFREGFRVRLVYGKYGVGVTDSVSYFYRGFYEGGFLFYLGAFFGIFFLYLFSFDLGE